MSVYDKQLYNCLYQSPAPVADGAFVFRHPPVSFPTRVGSPETRCVRDRFARSVVVGRRRSDAVRCEPTVTENLPRAISGRSTGTPVRGRRVSENRGVSPETRCVHRFDGVARHCRFAVPAERLSSETRCAPRRARPSSLDGSSDSNAGEIHRKPGVVSDTVTDPRWPAIHRKCGVRRRSRRCSPTGSFTAVEGLLSLLSEGLTLPLSRGAHRRRERSPDVAERPRRRRGAVSRPPCELVPPVVR